MERVESLFFTIHNISLQHPFLCTTIFVLVNYIQVIAWNLMWTGKIEPVYKRKLPRSWKEYKQELVIEWKNIKLLFHHAFGYPVVYYILLVVACIPLVLVGMLVAVGGVLSVAFTPTVIILLLILFKL